MTPPPEHRLMWRPSAPPLTVCLFILHDDLQLEEAKQLVRDAITAGIFCDLGSGSNVDLCVITDKKVDYLRTYDQPVHKNQR